MVILNEKLWSAFTCYIPIIQVIIKGVRLELPIVIYYDYKSNSEKSHQEKMNSLYSMINWYIGSRNNRSMHDINNKIIVKDVFIKMTTNKFLIVYSYI